MTDVTAALKKFAVEVIVAEELAVPVTVELMDLSMVPFFEMVAEGPNNLGILSFSKERGISGTLHKRDPLRVRFTSQGKSFVKDFSISQSAPSA